MQLPPPPAEPFLAHSSRVRNHCLQKNHFFLFIVSPTKLWSIFRQKMFLCKFWSKTGIFLDEKWSKKTTPNIFDPHGNNFTWTEYGSSGLARPASLVKVYRLYGPATINSAGCSGPPATKNLPAVRVCHPAKSTGCAGLSSTKVYRLCGSVIYQSLPAVRVCHLPKSTGCTGLPLTKVYRLSKSV
jgi:hypothetical protein